MKIYCDVSLENFEYWAGAVDTAEKITEAGKWGCLEAILEDLYPDGMTDTQLNDLLWFEPETVYEWLGITEEEEEEEGYKSPEECEDYDEFCGQFEGCRGCPYDKIPCDCEKLFSRDKEEI